MLIHSNTLLSHFITIVAALLTKKNRLEISAYSLFSPNNDAEGTEGTTSAASPTLALTSRAPPGDTPIALTPLSSASSSEAVDILYQGVAQLERFLAEARQLNPPTAAASTIDGTGRAATGIPKDIYEPLLDGFDSLKIGIDSVTQEVKRVAAMTTMTPTTTASTTTTSTTTITIKITEPAPGAPTASAMGNDAIAIAISRLGPAGSNVGERDAAARSGSNSLAKRTGSGASGEKFSHGTLVFNWWLLFLLAVFQIFMYNRWVKWFYIFIWARRSWLAVDLAYRRRRHSGRQAEEA
jgi:hypothetical protein